MKCCTSVVAATVAAAVLQAAPPVAAQPTPSPSPTPMPSPTPVAAQPTPTPTPSPSPSPSPSPTPSPTPTPTPTPSPSYALDPADIDPPSSGPPFRFSIGGGGALIITGSRGERWRGLAELDIYPGGRFGHYGITFAARSILFEPFAEAGLVTTGLTFEAAAARPRLILALHADVGITYGPDGGDDIRPAVGGGLKSHLGIIGPLAVASDLSAHLVIGNSDDLSLIISTGLVIALFR